MTQKKNMKNPDSSFSEMFIMTGITLIFKKLYIFIVLMPFLPEHLCMWLNDSTLMTCWAMDWMT